ncbi:hypothetical protein M758_7G112800 [Ceratodon purpureus]|nr:hypothetical protein M758_7G112800 [Ceratodon purpureus]
MMVNLNVNLLSLCSTVHTCTCTCTCTCTANLSEKSELQLHHYARPVLQVSLCFPSLATNTIHIAHSQNRYYIPEPVGSVYHRLTFWIRK